MNKELIRIVVIALILILAGWGISSWLNGDDSKIVPEEPIADENIVPEEPADNSTMEEPKQLTWDTAPKMQIDNSKSYKAILKTSKGDIEIELYAADNPITVNNFVFLAKEGYYENVKFHRILKDFMIQTGDPTGTGAGGPGYKFDDELPITKAYNKGIIAMANAGPNTNGSQFFIMHADYPLPPNYVIFGNVTEGLDTLDTISETKTENNGMGEISKPIENIQIQSVEILEN